MRLFGRAQQFLVDILNNQVGKPVWRQMIEDAKILIGEKTVQTRY